MRERAILAYALRRVAGATGATLGHILGVSPWRASDIARAGGRDWKDDDRLAAAVGGMLPGRVDGKQQT